MRKLLLISVVVLLVCQLGFAQITNASRAKGIVQATGHPTPVLPASLAKGPTHPTIWLSSSLGSKPKLVAGEPWFCDYNTGYQVAVCPKGVQTAYGTNFPGANGGAGMTIAIVDFFAYSLAESNFAQFNSDMGLPACTTANGCFHSVALTAIDGTGSGWDLESMLDLEYAHAMAPNAKIVYVQGDPYGDPGYYAESIAALGCPASPYCSMYGIASSPAGDVVSNSWTYNAGEVPTDDPYYNLPKPLLFASGDSSAWPYYSVTGYPCTSIHSTCVGGTSLYINPNLTRNAEFGWAGAGGGCSNNFAIPSWQGNVGSGICYPLRAAPDIAAIADPNTPVAVYICNIDWTCGYYGVGGTSVATPVNSGLVADINSARVSFGKAKLTSYAPGLYPAATSNYNYFFFDVVSGYNGFYAGPQFDLITGLGVPVGKDLGNRFFGLP
jgi:subtilase family serine protease